MSDQVRVRFAPSPTGHLHIGSARTALFNYLLARKTNGSFIIRVEDTDQARNVENGEEKLLKGLKWLGINWDESVDVGGDYGPYRSMDRLDIYHDHIHQLMENGQAYYCYCTPEEIEAEREGQLEKGETPKYSGKCRYLTADQKEKYEKDGRKPSVRFHVPEGKVFKVDDIIRGDVEFESDGVGDFVIARPDGIPTYNFAVTIDDYLMKITQVIRGEEHLSNTPRQIAIYQAFEWETPQFAHIPLILNQDRKKMSKRDESIIQFVEQYRELGFLPDAILNFIALLGWSPEGEEEIFTKEQLISQFSLERVAKSPAVFDIQKLFWMNNHYIKSAPIETAIELCLPHLQKQGLVPEILNEEQENWVKTLVGLYQEQLNYGEEIIELTKLFFEDELSVDDEGKVILSEDYIPVVIEEFKKQIEELTDYTPQGLKDALKSVQKNTGYKGKQLFMPVRVATTGATHGRDLPETLFLLGKEKVLKRLEGILTRQV